MTTWLSKNPVSPTCDRIVVSSIGDRGDPQSALVGIAVTQDHKVIFNTVSDSRKHRNLARDPRASLVFSGPDEKTLQLECIARPLALTGDTDADLREIYYAAWPDGRERLNWPNISYWCVSPRWARYSDFDAGPLIRTFDWPKHSLLAFCLDFFSLRIR